MASGFNRLGPLRKNAGNQDVASSQNEVLTEMTNIVGAAFLGVTVGCARCHDHKFDPFRQSDYYRLQAHFAQTQPNDIVLASKEEQDDMEGQGRSRCSRRCGACKASCAARPMPKRPSSKPVSKNSTPICRRRSASIYSVKDDPAKPAPIKILFHGDYLNPVAKVGVRPLGILLPEAHSGRAPRLPRSRASSWPTGSSIPPIR